MSNCDFTTEDKELQKLYDEIDVVFPALKKILDKYPNAFQLDYHGKQGYFMDYDVNVLIHHLRSQV